MPKARGHEHEVSLTFKYAYRPSLLRQAEATVSPHASQTNLNTMVNVSDPQRPSVCSPSSPPLRQDAIFQSFPNPSARGSPKRSQVRSSRQTPPLLSVSQAQASTLSPKASPRHSPRVTPRRTPVGELEQFRWVNSETASPLISNATGSAASPLIASNSSKMTGNLSLPLDGPSSFKLADSQKSSSNANSNARSNSLDRYLDDDLSPPIRHTDDNISKEAAILGLSTSLRYSETTPSPSEQQLSRLGSNPPRAADDTALAANARAVKQQKASSLFHLIRGPLTFPTAGKILIDSCLPRKLRKSATSSVAATSTTSLNGLPNSRVSQRQHSSPSHSKPHTPSDAPKTPSRSNSKRSRHGIGSWKHMLRKSADTSPSVDHAKEPSKIKDDDPASCFAAGEAHRFHTPIESPRMSGTPSSASAISPKTADPKAKKRLPSYFDLKRRDTANTSPFTENNRGFTLMALSDTEKQQREAIQTQAARLPHFVQVPMFSRAAPFAQTEDYSGASTEETSRRGSYPPGHGSSGRSSNPGRPESGRRASFGYRDHMKFITKPDGYSSRTNSERQNTDSPGSGPASGAISEFGPRDQWQRQNSYQSQSTESRKSSLGERRASSVIAKLDVTRRSIDKQVNDSSGNTSHAKQSPPKMVHWRGAEVTEEEAKILDMLVGRNRLFSEALMSTSPLDSPQTEESAPAPNQYPAPGEEPVCILRRPSWRRLASTIGSSPLSGLAEEGAPLDRTSRTNSGDGIREVRELYAEAVQETHGIAVGVRRNRKLEEDFQISPNLSPRTQRPNPLEFITTPPNFDQDDDLQPIETPAMGTSSRSQTTTTRTKYETEILSIALLRGRVVQGTTESVMGLSEALSANEAQRPVFWRAPSLTLPERPSMATRTNALEERSLSDSVVPGVNRKTASRQNSSDSGKAHRSSSTLAMLRKLSYPLSNKSVKEKDPHMDMDKDQSRTPEGGNGSAASIRGQSLTDPAFLPTLHDFVNALMIRYQVGRRVRARSTASSNLKEDSAESVVDGSLNEAEDENGIIAASRIPTFIIN
ncbi:hypothetical protein Dda_3223 [Drechslerella dactyloides]|uniref:Uncharacterized protein n=1 Tax=Drechslerella dactyloides TaxID=74499 RepID=A0AAD6J187_DREDA|nr:hypothetical protein Dda_3223 [Drechslerella dactyloides]